MMGLGASLMGFGAKPAGGNFGDKMKHAMCGVVFGFFVFVGSLAIIWWNEGRAVKTAATISEMESGFTPVECNKPAPAQGTLVYLSCPIKSANFDTFNAPDAIVGPLTGKGLWVQGNTKTFAYTEKESCTKGANGKPDTCTYTYSGPAWQSYVFPFKGTERIQVPDCSKKFSEEKRFSSTPFLWTDGGIKLDGKALSKFSTQPPKPMSYAAPQDDCKPLYDGCPPPEWQPLGKGNLAFILAMNKDGTPTKRQCTCPFVNLLPTSFSGGVAGCELSLALTSLTSEEKTTVCTAFESQTKIMETKYKNAAKPAALDLVTCTGNTCYTRASEPYAVGDCQYQGSVGFADVASIMGVVGQNGVLEKYVSKQYPDYSQFFVSDSTKTAAELVKDANDANKAITWFLRLVGFLLCWWGLQLVTGPISLVPTLIPCIGDFISGLVGAVLCCATCFVATFWSMLIMAIAWVRFRPAIGVPLLIVSIIAAVAFFFFRKKKKEEAAALATAQGKIAGDTQPAPVAMSPAPAQPAPAQGGYPAPGGGGYPAPDAGGYPAPGGAGGYPAPGGAGGYPAPGGAGGYPAPY